MAPSRATCILILAILFITVSANGVAAEPPTRAWETESNGLPSNTSMKLFSGDSDTYITESTYRNQTGENRSEIAAFLNGTDWSWEQPPEAARIWTENDTEAYAHNFSTNESVSKYPIDATLENQAWIRDAHATVIRMQPGTRLRVSPTETRQYLAPNGTASGLIDYRVRIPPDSTSGYPKVSWSLSSHEITDAWVLQGDGNPSRRPTGSRDVIGYRDDPSHVVSIPYNASRADEPIALSARIEVEMKKSVTTRTSRPTGGYDYDTTTTYPTKDVVVGEIRPARIYNPNLTVQRARYPDGTHEVLLSSEQVIDGVTVGSSIVELPWEYYAARDPDWDTIKRSTESGTSTSRSPLHPVRLYGYPASRSVSVENGTARATTWAREYQSPRRSLDDNINVGVVEGNYSVASSVVGDFDRELGTDTNASGVVAGVEANVTRRSAKQINRSNLTVRVENASLSNVTVNITLLDNTTGEPIDLRDRTGYVEINGRHRVNTNATGVATVRINNSGLISVRYQPALWSKVTTAYTADDTRVTAQTGMLTSDGGGRLLGRVFSILLPIFVILYIIDWVPGADTWPPWRALF